MIFSRKPKLQPVYSRLQPHVAVANLQNAEIDYDIEMEEPLPIGVPHGVENVEVTMEGLRLSIDGKTPELFFCDSHNYRVRASSVAKQGDGLDYPTSDKVRMRFECAIPQHSGKFNGEARVSVNGHIDVVITKLTPQLITEV